jgi:hypothetical protein
MIKSLDIQSTDWRAVRAYLMEKREELRTQLEADQPEIVTAQIRGKLTFISTMIDDAEPEFRPETTPEPYA